MVLEGFILFTRIHPFHKDPSTSDGSRSESTAASMGNMDKIRSPEAIPEKPRMLPPGAACIYNNGEK